ncbi:MAG TPA: ribonuclease III [Chitinophagales bacterium]|nr:ribonuclease III [Chitinophagales bacterium]
MPSQSTYELEEFYHLIGIYPKDSEKYFIAALTHASYDGNSKANYEQLEFLGDAVLSLIVAAYLFKKYPLKDEGELTKMRSFLVSRPHLNLIAEQMNLTHYIRHKIDDKKIDEAKDLGGDVVESILGAYYLDGGLETAQKIVLKWIINETEIKKASKKSLDPKSELHEWAQRRRRKLEFILSNPNIQNPSKFEIQVKMDDKLYGTGIGINKKTAEKNAAIQTLKLLDPNG